MTYHFTRVKISHVHVYFPPSDHGVLPNSPLPHLHPFPRAIIRFRNKLMREAAQVKNLDQDDAAMAAEMDKFIKGNAQAMMDSQVGFEKPDKSQPR